MFSFFSWVRSTSSVVSLLDCRLHYSFYIIRKRPKTFAGALAATFLAISLANVTNTWTYSTTVFLFPLYNNCCCLDVIDLPATIVHTNIHRCFIGLIWGRMQTLVSWLTDNDKDDDDDEWQSSVCMYLCMYVGRFVMSANDCRTHQCPWLKTIDTFGSQFAHKPNWYIPIINLYIGKN